MLLRFADGAGVLRDVSRAGHDIGTSSGEVALGGCWHGQHSRQPTPTFREMTADEPISPECRAERERSDSIIVLDHPIEGSAEVRVLVGERCQRFGLRLANEPRRERCCQTQIPVGVTPRYGVGFFAS